MRACTAGLTRAGWKTPVDANLAMAWVFGLFPDDGALLMVLAASASYIAVPAVVRHAIPEANPSLFIGMSPGLTFPFNIMLGIPIHKGVAAALLGPG